MFKKNIKIIVIIKILAQQHFIKINLLISIINTIIPQQLIFEINMKL